MPDARPRTRRHGTKGAWKWCGRLSGARAPTAADWSGPLPRPAADSPNDATRRARRLVGLTFVGFAVWSFTNFGQMVKQRVGERDWFVRHPNAFQRSAHLNFFCLVAFAALLFLAAMLMLFMPTVAKDAMEWYQLR